MTLYLLDMDEAGVNTCHDNCATACPPRLVDSEAAALVTGEGVSGELGVTEHTDST